MYGTILGAGVVSVVAAAGGPVIQHLFRSTGDRLRGAAGSARPQVGTPQPPAEGEFGEATVHGTRVRGWKRTAVASGAAFAIAIGGLGVYEAAAGTSISDGGGTLLSGGTRKAADHGQRPGREDGKGGGTSPDPGRSGGRSPEPDPAPSRSADHAPTPTPSPSEPDPTPPPKPSPTPTPSSTPSPPPPPPPTASPS
ncbi:hypothetical protein [Streptomyces cirratus]|uniref:hypothetical protein n=1 Tax=Streptomyces cirratus TaxID=68187 RepID=UPI003606B5C4